MKQEVSFRWEACWNLLGAGVVIHGITLALLFCQSLTIHCHMYFTAISMLVNARECTSIRKWFHTNFYLQHAGGSPLQSFHILLKVGPSSLLRHLYL